MQKRHARLPAHPRATPGARQLRAAHYPLRRASGRAAGQGAAAAAARNEPGAATAERRARIPVAALASRARPPPDACRARPVRVGRAFRGARTGGPADLRHNGAERGGDRRDLRAPRRVAARPRARRGAYSKPHARGNAHPAGTAARPADRRGPRPARSPAHAARRDRLELRPAEEPERGAARPARCVRGRVQPRGGRGRLRCHPRQARVADREEPGPPAGRSGRWAAVHAAGDDPRVRRRAARLASGRHGDAG